MRLSLELDMNRSERSQEGQLELDLPLLAAMGLQFPENNLVSIRCKHQQ